MDLPMIGPFAGPVVVVALVEALKRAGLPSRYAPVANVAFSTGWYALATTVAADPDLLIHATGVLNIALTALAAWGTYEGALWAGRRTSSA